MTAFTITEHKTQPDLIHASKHCGWCTKHPEHANTYLSSGRVWSLRKEGRRRPSYLVWITTVGKWELKGKANESIMPAKLCEEYPSIESWLKITMPDSSFSEVASQDTHATLSSADHDGTDYYGRGYSKNSRLLTFEDGTVISLPIVEPEKTYEEVCEELGITP